MARHQHHKGNADSQTLSPSQRYASFQKVQRHRASAAARFAESLPFELDDFQTEANDALEAGSNVLVAAPTGAGKTVVADFAIYLAQERNVKAFYTTPIKALSNQKYHDLKHQINLLKSGADSEKAEEYLEQMEREIKIYETQNKTGNKVLDTILTSKSMHCQRHGIELKFMGEGQLLNFMEDMDISALFGNMLDNAIESVVKIKDRQKRLISLHVIQDKQFIRIRTENYCEENVQFQDGIPITTKKDKRFHGYGMKSMKKIVEKYGGSVMAGKTDNWFELKILIPMKH